ncbi:tyrosine-type recombinase/integrase [Streptomyces sp. SDr-06]|uniref:tyrosine-type recombinase/integrase n=1 Tax=Streptomyces sp. SDr-06 TaxID=2267702 RepID=UPI0039836B84
MPSSASRSTCDDHEEAFAAQHPGNGGRAHAGTRTGGALNPGGSAGLCRNDRGAAVGGAATELTDGSATESVVDVKTAKDGAAVALWYRTAKDRSSRSLLVAVRLAAKSTWGAPQTLFTSTFEVPLTDKEARACLTATDGHRLSSLFELAVCTGLRREELLSLRWEDLDSADGTASIRRNLQRTPTGGLTALPTKTVGSHAASPSRPLPALTPCPPGGGRLRRKSARAGWTAAAPSPGPTGTPSNPPLSPATSMRTSAAPTSARSASTTCDTRPRPTS